MKWTVLLFCCLFLLSCGVADHETEQREKDTDTQIQTESMTAVDTEYISPVLYRDVQDEKPLESEMQDEKLTETEPLDFPMEYLLEVHALLVEHMIDLQIVGVGVSGNKNKVTIDVISEEHIAPIEELLNQKQINSECYDFCITGPIVPCGSVG